MVPPKMIRRGFTGWGFVTNKEGKVVEQKVRGSFLHMPLDGVGMQKSLAKEAAQVSLGRDATHVRVRLGRVQSR